MTTTPTTPHSHLTPRESSCGDKPGSNKVGCFRTASHDFRSQTPEPFPAPTEQAPSNPTEAAPPPTHISGHDDPDARSDSMPDLLSDGWSDSDSSQDARDVEMDIAPDDFDESRVSEDTQMNVLPSTAPVDQAQATDRRARVEEEVEPPPSQSNPAPSPAPSPRLYTGTEGPQPPPTLPPWISGPGLTQRGDGTPIDSHPPRPGRNLDPENAQQDARGPRFHAHAIFMDTDGASRRIPTSPEGLTFPRQFVYTLLRPQAQAPQPGQPPNRPGEHRDQPGQPGNTEQGPPIDFVVDGIQIGTLPLFFPTPGPWQQPPSHGPGNEGGPELGRDGPTLDEIRAMFFGEPPEEKEDPDRAMKLVEGLERVPVGLVKRMTRVDGVPGAHEDSTGAEGDEAPGCAICWDSLLSEESSEDAKLQFDPTPVKSEHPTEEPDSRPVISGSTPGDHASSTIISLPCSHVFHTSCLIPWFSKPNHTTCPTCRFDIDPRNLTYTPPQRRPRPTPTQPAPDPAASATTNSDEGSNAGRDPRPPAHVPFNPRLPNPGFLAAQPQQGPDRLPGQDQNEAPDNRHDFPQIVWFQSGSQQPVFGPPRPPGHPTHGPNAAAANAPHDHAHGPQPMPFPEPARGGVGHAHLQTPGFTSDITFHMEGLDPRITQTVVEQMAGIMRFFAGGGRGPGTGQPTGPTPNRDGANHESEAPRVWMPPAAPGPTLRQRVEAKERKAGLRCDDPSCGIGPSDEVPFPDVFDDPNSPSIQRVTIMKDVGNGAICGHLFHPACLVSADRCAGWGEEDRGPEKGRDEYEVVSCPVCRNVGKVQKEVWEEGAKELLV